MFQADEPKGQRPKVEVRRGRGWSWGCRQDREGGQRERGQGPGGHSGDTELKCREKSQEGDEIWLWDQGPHPAAPRSLKWLPTAFWKQSKLLGLVDKVSLPEFFPQPPVPPPSPAPGPSCNRLSCSCSGEVE